MFPVSNDLPASAATATAGASIGGKSFLFDFKKGDFVVQDGRLVASDDLDAVMVWVEKIIRTEKGRFPIYDGTTYGIQLEDLLIGGSFPPDFIESELKREVEEALTQHPKITGVSDLTIDRGADGVVAVSFTILFVGGATVERKVAFDG